MLIHDEWLPAILLVPSVSGTAQPSGGGSVARAAPQVPGLISAMARFDGCFAASHYNRLLIHANLLGNQSQVGFPCTNKAETLGITLNTLSNTHGWSSLACYSPF